MASVTFALPFLLLLFLIAAATPTQSSLSSSPSNPGLPKESDEKSSAKWESGEEREDGGEEEKTPLASAEGVHKIQVREAGPSRFWSGSRYGRSSGIPKSDSRGSHFQSSREMSMSLRSSNPVVQPRHDRFFLGSRYGKRSQAEEWRKGRDEEEESVPEDSEEGEEEKDRLLEEAAHFRVLGESGKGLVTSQKGPTLEIQPVSCVYTGIGNLYRCYDGRQEATSIH